MFRIRRRPLYAAMKSRFPRRHIKFLALILFIYLLVQTFLVIESNLRPTIIALAQARAKVLATEAVNFAINQKIAKESRYEHLIFIQKDNEGNVVMAEVNNMELARIQSLTTMNVQSALKDLEEQKIKIPLGQVLGSEILANLGPKIPVSLVPIGTVSAKMVQSFESSGINIVSHQVGIEIIATVHIVIPFMTSDVNVNTYTPIVTATFFGRVPETVINLPMPYDFQFPSNSDTK
ncbi:MAG: sporulation protein YunB [Eubacteriales bacterium]|nr:sporulation protein YunB [Eubacteriales bacterium]